MNIMKIKETLYRWKNLAVAKYIQFKCHHSKEGRVLVREARSTDVYGACDILKLIDAKLALVQKMYESCDVYVNQKYDLRNIKIVRALIRKYLEDDFFDYEWPVVDFKKDFLGGAKYIPKVYVNPRTIDKVLAEMDPVGSKNEKLVQWYKTHIDEVYRYKLNRLIWNILRDQWTYFSL